MLKTKSALRRREFLIRALAAGGVLSGSVSPSALPAESAGSIPTRVLGKTGLKLPILGYGGAALPKAWRNPLSHEDRVKLVRHAYDRGLRYFDTAGNYMESQAILAISCRSGEGVMSGGGQADVVFYLLEGHGHGWPMQRGRDASDTGPKTRDFSAPEEFWAFFKELQ